MDTKKASVSASGDMGWTWGIYVMTVREADGTVRTSHGKYLNVWEKQPDGEWKVVADIGNESPEPEAEAGDK